MMFHFQLFFRRLVGPIVKAGGKADMNILVCIKQVPESNKVEVDPKTGVRKETGQRPK